MRDVRCPSLCTEDFLKKSQPPASDENHKYQWNEESRLGAGLTGLISMKTTSMLYVLTDLVFTSVGTNCFGKIIVSPVIFDLNQAFSFPTWISEAACQ